MSEGQACGPFAGVFSAPPPGSECGKQAGITSGLFGGFFRPWLGLQCASEVLCSTVSVEAGDGDACSSEDTRVAGVLETTEVP